jgi:hypothetical protein
VESHSSSCAGKTSSSQRGKRPKYYKSFRIQRRVSRCRVNLTDISTQLLFTTIPIWVERDGGAPASATAFFYNVPVADKQDTFIPFLVTNYHVVARAKRGVIEVVGREGDLPVVERRVRIEIDSLSLTKFVSDRLDIAAIPIGGVLNQLQAEGRPPFFRSVDASLLPTNDALNDLSALEEIVFIGYPAGLRDERNAMPIMRRGITATPAWNDFEGGPNFLIDAGVYPGSSGSPVFILNQGAYATRTGLSIGSRLVFLGVIVQAMLTSSKDGAAFLGLGKVVRSTAVREFLDGVADGIARESGSAIG